MPDSGEFDGTAIVELPLPKVEGGENAGSSTMVGNCTRCAHAGAPVNHNATSALARQTKTGERIAFKLGTECERWDSAPGERSFSRPLLITIQDTTVKGSKSPVVSRESIAS